MNKKKAAAALTALIMTLTMAGCADNSKQTKSISATVTKGRYVESEVIPPEEANDLFYRGEFIKSGDDISYCPESSNVIFTSSGEGFEIGTNDIRLSDEYYCGKIMRLPNGVGALTYVDAITHEELTAGSYSPPNSYFAVIAPDGSITETDLDGNDIVDFEVTADGRIFAITFDCKLYETDPSTGKSKPLTGVASAVPLYMDVCGKYIFLTSLNSDKVLVYDIEAGSMYTNTDALSEFWKNNVRADNDYAINNYDLFEGEEGTVYIVCLKGIYRYILGGNTVEKLVDGGSSSFGITGSIGDGIGYGCYEGNDSFLVQCADGKLMRYRFDPEAEDIKKSELRIFTLVSDQELMTAVNFYRKSDPTVDVIIEEGMADGRTYEDAMKELTTQMVSDNPPDVIILDNMDIQSLKDKGALADLSGDIKELSPEGGLIEGAALWNNDGGVYSAAGLFSLPSLACDTKDIDSIKDFKSLADSAGKNFDKKDKRYALSLEDIPQENYMENMLLLNGSELLDGKGQPDTAKLRDFFDSCKRIYDASAKNDGSMDYYESFRIMSNILANVSSYEGTYHYSPVIIKDYNSDLCMFTSLYDYNKDVQIKYGINDSVHSFIPRLNTAVCSSAKNPEGAKRFIASMLSEETQDNLGQTALAVNRKVFEDDFVDSPDVGTCFSLMTEEGEQFFTPEDTNEAEEKQLMEYVDNLDTAVVFDSQTRDAVCESGAKLLRGELTLDEAVKETESFLSLRSKE